MHQIALALFVFGERTAKHPDTNGARDEYEQNRVAIRLVIRAYTNRAV